MATISKPDNSVSFETHMRENGTPLVFKNATTDWDPEQWTLGNIQSLLGDKQMKCKISSIQPEDFQWESECVHIQITIQQYIDWLNDGMKDDNPLRLFDKLKYSCYIDYKYMREMFADQPDVLKSVSWESFGLEDRDGEDSTIWIGSQGAYTACHQDTYGFNLVAQIHGRKRWYLFDPSQTDCMYPTRIPYEESSVYSEVNIRYPDLTKHPLFKKATPYIVELVPGDVLYVPRHWWHFVESLEPTITINTWVPLSADRQSRVAESLNRLLFTSLSSSILTHSQCTQFLNTGEELLSASLNIEYVQMATKDLIDNPTRHPTSYSQEAGQSENEKQKSDQCIDYFNSFLNKFKNEQISIKMPSTGKCKSHPVLANNGTTLTSANKQEAISPGKTRAVDMCDPNSATKLANSVDSVQSDKHVSFRSATKDEERVKIYAIQSLQFDDFVKFLEDNFQYESLRKDNDVGCCSSSDNDKQESGIAMPTLHDIFNAILEPSVISHISDVLIKRCQK